jgi:hypothetical protein
MQDTHTVDTLEASTIQTATLAESLKSQYRASLAMLREAIEKCPDTLWARESDLNKTWQVAYHALYFVHLYAQPTLEDFVPWSGQHPESQNDDCFPGNPSESSTLPVIPEPYAQAEVLSYHQFCEDSIGSWIDRLDLASASSGFPWYPISKLEHQLLNLRHVMQHTGQIMERVRSAANVGVRWRGAVRQEG